MIVFHFSPMLFLSAWLVSAQSPSQIRDFITLTSLPPRPIDTLYPRFVSSISTPTPSFTSIIKPATSNAATSTIPSRTAYGVQRKCNGYSEFCNRKFSNVSMVVAHNSPFAIEHNSASNQQFGLITQLRDGIRGLQFQTHFISNTSKVLFLCHTTCDLLNAGTLENYLTRVRHWLSVHPNEVLTLMIGNNGRVAPSAYIPPFTESGMLRYIYTPPPPSNATLDAWPTLGEMIDSNRRVVVMLDYGANQTQVPWLLDEFSYQWETPFSPTNDSFPCTQHRPPHQSPQVSRNRMYMLNHNLNVRLERFGQTILLPAIPLLDRINAASGNVSLGAGIEACTRMWGKPPTWLLVDFYNRGDFPGSVFAVAAKANGVVYEKGSCCGKSRDYRAFGRGLAAQLFRVFYIAWFVCLLQGSCA